MTTASSCCRASEHPTGETSAVRSPVASSRVTRSPEEQQRLDAAYSQYDAAMLRRDRAEVAAARLRLIQVLVETGWDAPEEVRDQVLRDQKVLRRAAEAQAEAALDVVRPPTHRQPPRRRGRRVD